MVSAELVHAGFSNYVATGRIVAIVETGSAPIDRLVRAAKSAGRVIDMTAGRRTKAVLFTDSGWVLLSAIKPETLASREGGRDD